MSSVIVNKLKEIEEANKTGTRYPIPKDISASETKSGSGCKALSQEQTVSILTNNDSDYYQEYHTVNVWAGKLRSLSSKQRLYAEKAIYDVLFEAQLGKLNKSSVKINDFCTKKSHTIFNAKSCNYNLSERSLESDQCEKRHRVPSSQNDEHDYRSSEVIIAESFPTELDVISSECQAEFDKLQEAYGDQKRPTKFLGVVSSFLLPTSSRSQSRDCPRSDSEDYTIDSNDSISRNLATNTPDNILMQLSRYMNYFYNCIRNYV